MSSEVAKSPWGTGVSGVTPPKPIIVRMPLETSRDLHKALARLIRASMGNKIATADLSRYAAAISVLHKIVSDGEELAALESRLSVLEGQSAR